MKNQAAVVFLSLSVVLGVTAPPCFGQDQSTQEEVESLIRAQYEAWNTGDLEEIGKSDWWSAGFGFRTLLPRGTQEVTKEFTTYVARMFLESMEYYRMSIDEIHVDVHGDVAVGWGFHTEDFQVRGREPEMVKVRFTLTLLKTDEGWKSILAHRDSQPFDSEGNYIPATKGSATRSSPIGL